MKSHMFITKQGNSSAKIRIIWLHGWGQNHSSLLKLSSLFNNEAENYLIDLPGFGQSAAPTEIWGTIDYTKSLIAWLQALPPKETYIIGHSFGGRIAIQAAQMHPNAMYGIILIAAAGLKKKRTMLFKIKAMTLKYISTSLRIIDKYLHTAFKEKFSRNFGSRDYKATQGVMRGIFVKTVNEDLSTIAAFITVPTLLIYGTEDQETPSQFGEIYNKLIKDSSFFALPGFDHHNILSLGRHQVYNLITQFLQRAQTC